MNDNNSLPDWNRRKSFLIAAASSGSGKTTLTMGLLRALRRRTVDVQPCKCGPDYIDTQYHRIASGKPSYNIDPWMGLSVGGAAQDNGLLVEGCMGLFDGAVGRHGSNAEVAQQMQLPVILIVNARSMAHSAAPLLYGYRYYCPEITYAGVIYNNVGSAQHEEMLCQAAREVGMNVLGCIPRQAEIEMPSRHLGLDLLQTERISEMADRVADLIEAHTDLMELWKENREGDAEHRDDLSGFMELLDRLNRPAEHKSLRICVARDEAFSFIYQETLDRLAETGTVSYFSPLRNEPVPEGADVIYLPGGYPELFLAELEKSTQTMESLRRSQARIIAECGGMMYLGQFIDGARMTGLLPISSTMENARLHLGYRRMNWTDGTEMRGHEFHYSDISSVGSGIRVEKPFADARGISRDTLLLRTDSITASYVHWSPAALLKIIQSAD
jgi:cobyrinic acid a,c-diamide synthase